MEVARVADPILELRALHLGYGSVSAVRGLDISIMSGETVGLIGANGAGKTTTLLAIMGAIPVEAGDIVFEGESLLGRQVESRSRLGIGLVPEGRRIFGGFTVEENVRLGVLGRDDLSGVADDLDWVYSLFPIVAEFADRTAGELSGGQQQQLAIARALVAKPKLLLLDEPSLGLAPTVVESLFDALEEIRQSGVTILMVEQRAQLTAEFADRTVVMRTGEVAMTIEEGQTADADQMALAYFGT